MISTRVGQRRFGFSVGRLRVAPSLLRGVVGLIAFALLWEIVARFVVANPLFLPSLGQVAIRGEELWISGELGTHIWVSFQEFAWGFASSAVIGVLAGICLAEWRGLREFVDPIISLLYATPLVALGPLFISGLLWPPQWKRKEI